MADYKKLAQLIADNKGELCRKLEDLFLPSDAERIKQLCIDYVGVLTRKDAEYLNQLSLLEQDLLSPVLKVIETLYSSDMELNKKVGSLSSEDVKSAIYPCYKEKYSTKRIVKEYGPAMVGAVGGTLIATLCKPSSWGVILFGSVISAIVGKVLYGVYIEHGCLDKESKHRDYKYPEFRLSSEDVDNIIKGLETAGECIDTVLLTYRRHLDIMQKEYSHKVASFNLDKKYIGILECYQTILGNLYSIETTPVIADTIKQVNNSLLVQGYKAIRYSVEMENFFEIREDDCSDVEEFKPAIIKKEESKEILILKGEVVLPKNNSNENRRY